MFTTEPMPMEEVERRLTPYLESDALGLSVPATNAGKRLLLQLVREEDWEFDPLTNGPASDSILAIESEMLGLASRPPTP